MIFSKEKPPNSRVLREWGSIKYLDSHSDHILSVSHRLKSCRSVKPTSQEEHARQLGRG